ncbi:MAG: arsenate reductase (azurin) small subunit [Planctomycetota bacterium]
MSSQENKSCSACNKPTTAWNRRGFLQLGTAGVATVLLADVFPNAAAAEDAHQTVQLATFPKIKVADLASIEVNKPIEFAYPNEEVLHSGAMLIRLGKPAGGGVGDDQDIVAFSTRCTHLGGDLSEGYVSEHSLLGCGEHLTTFDLTRHGMVVAGHATQSLPQIVLTIEDDEIFATGIVGLLYGHHQNPTQPVQP